MSEPTLADVIARLDRLEGALYELIEVVRAGTLGGARPAPIAVAAQIPVAPPRPVAPPVAVSPGTAAPGEPPLIQVAPPMRGGAPELQAQSIAAAAIPSEAKTEPERFDPYAYRLDLEVPPPNSPPIAVMQRVFEAGLMIEPEDTWALMTKLTHPTQMVGPRALEHFKAFNWHKLRRTAATYLRNPADPRTFEVAYMDPGEITPDVNRVRLFIRAGDNRMPVPVGMARDAAQGNAWRITLMSL